MMNWAKGFGFGCGFGLMMVVAMGAFQARPDQEYLNACQAITTESSLVTVLKSDPARSAAAKKRYDYWLSIIEKFKP